jgi:hypothetical protein
MRVSRLSHVGSGFYFQFDQNDRGGHLAVLAPGADQSFEVRNSGSWEFQVTYFREWIGYVRRELATPDPWPHFFSASDLILEGEANAADNSRFDEAEYRDIGRRLEDIRAYLLPLSDNEAQREGTNSKIDYLVTQARTAGRRDWFFMAIGVLLSEIASRALASEQVRQLFELLVRGVHQLTGG